MVRAARRSGDKITFNRHDILSRQGSPRTTNGVQFSQLHAIDLVDMDGDGLKDIVTGKRYWAHGPNGDAEPNAPAVLYWFQLKRERAARSTYVPHQIDDDSGVGTQVIAADVNDDKPGRRARRQQEGPVRLRARDSKSRSRRVGKVAAEAAREVGGVMREDFKKTVACLIVILFGIAMVVTIVTLPFRVHF